MSHASLRRQALNSPSLSRLSRLLNASEMAETKVRDAIRGKLNIEVDIDRAHCVERRKSEGINEHQAGAKPRVILCRLVVSAVVKKARKEKPEELFICEDLSQATLEKKKPHLEKLKAAKQAGKSAYFSLDRLQQSHTHNVARKVSINQVFALRTLYYSLISRKRLGIDLATHQASED